MHKRQLLCVVVFCLSLPVAGWCQSGGNMGGNPYSAVNSVDHARGPGAESRFTESGLSYDNVAIIFSKLAAQKSSNSDVRSFAQKVVSKHMEIGAGLVQDAKAMGVKAPVGLPAEYQQDFADLQKLNGDPFDQKYLSVIVRAQREDHDTMQSMENNPNHSLSAQASHYESTLLSLNIDAEKLEKKLAH